jgi:hypothetical protein
VQYFRVAGRFVQDFHAEGSGFQSKVMFRMKRKWKRQGKQNVVQRMLFESYYIVALN